MKKCNLCKALKDEAAFSKCSSTKDGLQRRCKDCATAVRRAYHKDYPTKYMWQHVKDRCKRTGIVFDLRIEDIPTPHECPILGIPLHYGAGIGVAHGGNSASIDRIDSNRGYTKDNIVVISDRANRIKRDATYQELLAIGNWLKKYSRE